jgi:hypothetical protein
MNLFFVITQTHNPPGRRNGSETARNESLRASFGCSVHEPEVISLATSSNGADDNVERLYVLGNFIEIGGKI